MKTLFTLEKALVHIPTPSPSPSPWKPTIPFLNPTTTMKNPYSAPKTWRIHAEPKGFNGKPNSKLRESDSKQRKEEDGDEIIPQVVRGRIIRRIVFNTVVPLVIGLGLLQGLSVVNDRNLWQVPRWLPFLTTFITFGASALGIAYGTLSTSWDEDKKGSILGFEEVEKNWAEMWSEVDDD